MTDPIVLAINISPGGIPKSPRCVAQVSDGGLVGDGHDHDKHNSPLQALCLIDIEDLEDLAAAGFAVGPGATGENITMRGLECDELVPGDRLVFSGGVEAEVTKKRQPCFVLDAIDPELKKAMVDRAGCYAKVLTPGEVRPGETVGVIRAAHAAPTA